MSKPEEVAAAREAAKALFDWDESDPLPEKVTGIFRTLCDETDRGAVLVAAALLDEDLEDLLRAKCTKNVAVVKRAIDPLLKSSTAPLRSSWAKAALAYALGLIAENLFLALGDIRKLRNAFAHSTGPVSLSEATVRTIVNRLALHLRMAVRALTAFVADEVAEVKAVAPESKIPPSLKPERVTFIAATALIHGELLKARSAAGA